MTVNHDEIAFGNDSFELDAQLRIGAGKPFDETDAVGAVYDRAYFLDSRRTARS